MDNGVGRAPVIQQTLAAAVVKQLGEALDVQSAFQVKFLQNKVPDWRHLEQPGSGRAARHPASELPG